ncbi:MAG: FAD-binding oxidoreductase [Anaerolineaceae bacterium]|nr:FAD-binding oxidoreductase [Anaerolineaceae bacterium]
MKRIQGWGNIETDYPVPEPAKQYLANAVGQPLKLQNVAIETLIQKVPSSQLPDHPLITTDAEDRLRHSRGQSLNDWIDMCDGLVDTFPDGVAYPTSDADVRELITYAKQHKINLVPYGGGSSVVGHLTPPGEGLPTLSVDMAKMNQLLNLNEINHEATFAAGVSGPDLEKQLSAHGYVLGHFPQSWEYSTLGGWVVTRSVGQQSIHYGRIEPLFVTGHMETPSGPLDFPHVPKSAAGPDLRHLAMGSEARLGILTQATVRIRHLPRQEHFYSAFFPDFETGVKAVRQIAQAELPLSMLRLSDPQETETTFQLSGAEKLIKVAKAGLNLVGQRDQRCMLIYGLTGNPAENRLADIKLSNMVRANKGLMVKFYLGKEWIKKRFLTPYLRNTLWDLGYALDTLETALPWDRLEKGREEILRAIRTGLEDQNEIVLVFSHVSHVYTNGGSMYVTYLYRRSQEPEETLARWRKLKTAASEAIVANGGTISHQHGVGLDHKPYLPQEKGPLGIHLIRETIKDVDPDQLMNRGKLLDLD